MVDGLRARRTVAPAACVAIALCGAGCVQFDRMVEPWTRYSLPGSSVSIELPGAPAFAPHEVSRPCGIGRGTELRLRSNARLYTGSVLVFGPECDAFLSAYLQEALRPQHHTDPDLIAVRPVSVPGASGVEFTFRQPDTKRTFAGQTFRTYMAPRLSIHLEVLSEQGETASPHILRYLDSLVIGR